MLPMASRVAIATRDRGGDDRAGDDRAGDNGGGDDDTNAAGPGMAVLCRPFAQPLYVQVSMAWSHGPGQVNFSRGCVHISVTLGTGSARTGPLDAMAIPGARSRDKPGNKPGERPGERLAGIGRTTHKGQR